MTDKQNMSRMPRARQQLLSGYKAVDGRHIGKKLKQTFYLLVLVRVKPIGNHE